MRIRRTGTADAALDDALAAAGVEVVDDPAATLLHTLEDVDGLDGFTPALTGWAAEARRAVDVGADVITIVGAGGFDTDEPAAAMLAHGIVGATRALAFERDRKGGRVNLIAVGDADAGQVAATVRWLLDAPVSAEVVELGAARHGRLPV
jgi:hypothetical protein